MLFLRLRDGASTVDITPPLGTPPVHFAVGSPHDDVGGLYVVRYPAIARASIGDDAYLSVAASGPEGEVLRLRFGGSLPPSSEGESLLLETNYDFQKYDSFFFNGISGDVCARPAATRPLVLGYAGRDVVIATSGFQLNDDDVAALRYLGAAVVDPDIRDLRFATHLVVATPSGPFDGAPLRRTIKLLGAAAIDGLRTTNFRWIKDSIASGQLLDASREQYVPSDPPRESAFGLSLSTLAHPSGFLAMEGVAVFVDSGSTSPYELNELVRLAGGLPVDSWECFEDAAAAESEAVVACFGYAARPDKYKGAPCVIDGEGILRAVGAKKRLNAGAWKL